MSTNSLLTKRDDQPSLTVWKVESGSEGGGETWVIATTLIRTAILNGVDPQAWLTKALERMVGGEVRSTDLATLLPWTWRDAQRAALAA